MERRKKRIEITGQCTRCRLVQWLFRWACCLHHQGCSRWLIGKRWPFLRSDRQTDFKSDYDWCIFIRNIVIIYSGLGSTPQKFAPFQYALDPHVTCVPGFGEELHSIKVIWIDMCVYVCIYIYIYIYIYLLSGCHPVAVVQYTFTQYRTYKTIRIQQIFNIDMIKVTLT